LANQNQDLTADSPSAGIPESERRRFLHKLFAVAALGGLASLLQSKADLPIVSGDMMDGSVAFYAGGKTTGDNSQLFWDDALHRLGVGTGSPQAMLHISGVSPNILMGDASNMIASGVVGGTVSGGGGTSGSDSAPNLVNGNFGTVGGGAGNQANFWATVGGGYLNMANHDYSSIAGGFSNTAGGGYASVGGGNGNAATGYYSTVGGGFVNTAIGDSSTVAGGYANQAEGFGAAVGGGGYDGANSDGNAASGNASTVPGGIGNTSGGDRSFAAGSWANVQAAHHGSILFSDDSVPWRTFDSVAADEFAVRAAGGVRFVTATDGSGNPTQTFTITSRGAVGIGTTTPSFSVHLVSNNSDRVRLAVENVNGTSQSALLELIGSSQMWLLATDVRIDGGNNFGIYGGNDWRLYIDGSAGNVGIGTTKPTHLVQLRGGAYSDGATWNPASSIRWKENITPLTGALDAVKELSPVSYEFKDARGRKRLGFIAEEIGEVIPSIVDWDQAEAGYAEGYDPTAILALAVQAIKELSERNRQLTDHNEELRTDNNDLRARLEAVRLRVDAIEQTIKPTSQNAATDDAREGSASLLTSQVARNPYYLHAQAAMSQRDEASPQHHQQRSQ
jgi:hypothetical protein